jgi:(E)-4-hydroxy-3-methylbut-2-enyl-diphosphate synthase
MIYLDGEIDHRIDNGALVDHLVELVEKRAAEIQAQEAKDAVAAE